MRINTLLFIFSLSFFGLITIVCIYGGALEGENRRIKGDIYAPYYNELEVHFLENYGG